MMDEISPATARLDSDERPGLAMIANCAAPYRVNLHKLVAAGIPLYGFKIRDLLRLESGQVIESGWPEAEDVPLCVGQVQVAWSEFEVVEQRLAVRLTRLA